jgi:hypothetical protein
MNFKEFLHFSEQNTVGKHNDFATAAFMSTDQTGSEGKDNLEGRGNHLPGVDLLFPSVMRGGVISSLGPMNDNGEPTTNPVPVRLSDNTQLSLTWGQYHRIGRPKPGWSMTVHFLRALDDESDQKSGVHKIETRDPDSGKTFRYMNWPG